MAGVSKCMKYSMFIFNFLFWVCGCIILRFSIWIRITSAQQVEAVFNLTLSLNVDALQSTTGEYKEYQEEFQKFEKENKCCGLLNGPADWGKKFYKPSSKICQCEEQKPSSNLCTKYQDRYIYKKPCGEVIMKYIKDNLAIIMGIAFGLTVIEIIGLVFSMSLYCQIGRK